MKDLDFRGNILSGTKYRASPEGAGLLDDTNNQAGPSIDNVQLSLWIKVDRPGFDARLFIKPKSTDCDRNTTR